MCNYGPVRSWLTALAVVLNIAMGSVIFAASVQNVPLWGQIASGIAFWVAATLMATAVGLAIGAADALKTYCDCLGAMSSCAGACKSMSGALGAIMASAGALAAFTLAVALGFLPQHLVFWLVALLVALTISVIAAIAASVNLSSCPPPPAGPMTGMGGLMTGQPRATPMARSHI
jgi:hypothetical protein